MDIIFFWNSELRTEENSGTLLSGKYEIYFNLEKNFMKIESIKSYVSGFWGNNVLDCFALVGENGSGKTMLANDIMYTIRDIKVGVSGSGSYLILFEVTGLLYYICSEDLTDIEFEMQEDIQHPIKSNGAELLKKYHIAYFHNALSDIDYLAQGRCEHDFSLGHQIYSHRRTTYEMHYDDLNRDSVMNFYGNEDFRIVSFLYDYAIYKPLNIDFPFPKKIRISVADSYYNEEDILGRAKGLRVNQDEEEMLNEDIYQFSRGVANIIVVYGRTWITMTIKRLLFNMLKELCIPDTTPTNITYEHKTFFRACKILNDTNKLKKTELFQCVNSIIDKLRYDMTEDINCIENLGSFVQWLEVNYEQICTYEDSATVELVIPVQKESENFISELIKLYSRVNFAFPFYRFSFGVSTGEYFFLSTFSNLYSMVKKEENRINVYDYVGVSSHIDGMLIIFDEIDMSLHPRWQRMFMKWLTNFCDELFKGIPVKLIVTTHSPILLSDFPGNSVLYLRKYNNRITLDYNGMKTFGCNIHSMFLNSFFLEEYGTMGAFAEDKINEVARIIYEGEVNSDNEDRIKGIVAYIGEDIIKQKLEIQLDKRTQKKVVIEYAETKVLRDTLEQLKKQKYQLEQMIKNIEDGLHDKNTY